MLRAAPTAGLDRCTYLTSGLQRSCGDGTVPEPAACELQLTDNSLLRYARDVGYGARAASEADPAWHIERPVPPPEDLLRAVANSDDLTSLLRQLPPQHAGYQRLRTALAGYRRLPSAG